MNSRSLLLSTFLFAVPFVAQPAAAQTVLPPIVQADRVTIQQDQTLAQNVLTQLRADEVAGNAAAVAADRTALRLAEMKVAQDFETLHQDAQPIVQPDRAALVAALTQLESDQLANNAGALQTDRAAVVAADLQLGTDREAIFGGLGAAGRMEPFGGMGARAWGR